MIGNSAETPDAALHGRAIPWVVALAAMAFTVVILRWEGRRWWCACGELYLWASNIDSSHCSQHLFDPYSFTHIEHGLIAFSLLTWLRPGWSVSWRLCATVLYACGWEILENSTFIIERYRAHTLALNYLGDSVGNSMGDILSCAAGFAIASKLGVRRSLALFVVLEVLLLLIIRDNLTLNIVMLLYPVNRVKAWQMGR